jgi:hypothetical protein
MDILCVNLVFVDFLFLLKSKNQTIRVKKDVRIISYHIIYINKRRLENFETVSLANVSLEIIRNAL